MPSIRAVPKIIHRSWKDARILHDSICPIGGSVHPDHHRSSVMVSDQQPPCLFLTVPVLAQTKRIEGGSRRKGRIC
jgi:hypothetical protein